MSDDRHWTPGRSMRGVMIVHPQIHVTEEGTVIRLVMDDESNLDLLLLPEVAERLAAAMQIAIEAHAKLLRQGQRRRQ